MSIIKSMNDDTYTPCTKCGRPMAYCKGKCGCKRCGCDCKEYGPAVCGAIRPRQPECPYTAVIPSLTVDHVDSLRDLCDTFVHVSDINTTFYIDDKHRTIITWAGPVEYDNYDLATNTLGLRSQFLIDFANDRGAYYNKTGNYKTFSFGGGGGGNAPISLTLDSYSSDVQDWVQASKMGADLFKHEDSSYADYEYVTGFVVPSPVFSNDATGETLSLEDVYEILESEDEVLINGIPHIYAGKTRGNLASIRFMGTHDGVSGFSTANIDAYSDYSLPAIQQYSATFMEHYATNHGDPYSVVPDIFDVPVGLRIVKEENNGVSSYTMVVPGLVFDHVIYS